MNAQLEAQNIIMSEGRINSIDATPIAAAQSGPSSVVDGEPTRDCEAGWHVKQDSRGQNKSTVGYLVHTGVDEEGFIHRQSVTSGNVYDSQKRDTIILGDEASLYADAADSSKETREQPAHLGSEDQAPRKGDRNHPLSTADKARNRRMAVIRSGSERPLATYRQHYGVRRTRFMGLVKNITFYSIAAIAATIRKGAKFVSLYGLPAHLFIG